MTLGVSYTAACAVFQLPSPELVFPDCGGGSLTDASYFGPNLAVVVTGAGKPHAVGLRPAGYSKYGAAQNTEAGVSRVWVHPRHFRFPKLSK